jgi:hypothetical protein
MRRRCRMVKFLLGFLFGVVIIRVMTMMSRSIKENKESRERDEKIIKEYEERQEGSDYNIPF